MVQVQLEGDKVRQESFEINMFWFQQQNTGVLNNIVFGF